MMKGSKAKFGSDGKWVSPYQKDDKGNFTLNNTKEEFEAKG